MDPDRSIPFKKLGITFWAFVCLFIIASFSCNKSKKISKEKMAAYSKYIEAYTSGVVSKTNTIRIQLVSEVSVAHTLNEPLKENYFSFSPSVKGKAYWVDDRTIEFKPDEYLKPDKTYEIEFALGKIVKVSDDLKVFPFTIKTIKPSFMVNDDGLTTYANSKDKMQLTGVIETADVEKNEDIEKILSASQENQNKKITWQHNEQNKTHQFTVADVERKKSASQIKLAWDGSKFGMDVKDEKIIEVPAQGEFKVLSIRAVQGSEEYTLIQFSDPLSSIQDLNGLISVGDIANTSYSIQGNEVRIYSETRLEGNYSVTIHEGIQNSWGDKLKLKFSGNVNFENQLPSVKIVGRGVILPSAGDKLVLPFDAINLKSVDVSIIKIFENNIVQFLQTNSFESDYSLRTVAQPVVQATIALDNDKTLNLHKKQRFLLDIDKYLKTEPGAIYRVMIGFRPEYSIYNCNEKPVTPTGNEENDDVNYYGEIDMGYNNQSDDDEDDAFWIRYNNYYPFGYNWEQRNNPCKPSYYNREKWAFRNIIASNIGLTAKKDNSNLLTVTALNLIDTKPMKGVEVEVRDYQNQILGKALTDDEGKIQLECKRKPYFVISKNGNERGYLKLDDGSSLPMARFEVDGEQVRNGLKGFIFGERGVWRPGDSIYLSFILQDKENKLPEGHPLEFDFYTPQGQLFQHAVQTLNKDGFYSFKTKTEAASPTGNWLAKIKVGGTFFEKRIKVETVKPNRLKINLSISEDQALGVGGKDKATLSSKWLFGADAKLLKATIDATISSQATSFKKFPDYTFDNPTTNFSSEYKVIFDGTLDATGNASFNTDFKIGETAPGKLKASLVTKVYEPGGGFSIDQITVPYNPFKTYVGIKLPEGEKPWNFLLSGKKHTMDIVNVDINGNAVGNEKVQIEFYKVEWRWWWDRSETGYTNFNESRYTTLIRKDEVSLINGKGKWAFQSPGSEDWGRYLIIVKDPVSGHATGEYFYFDTPYWQSRNNSDDPSAATMLSFSSDKEKYNVGDEVTLTIPGTKNGVAMISLETGSKVLKTFQIKTDAGQTNFKFKAESSMTPTVYANVSLIQPHAQSLNDLPIRMYGVKPLMIEDVKTILNPVLTAPESFRSEKATSITIGEKDGREMSYCVAIVDEGLLDLTRFKTPNPHSSFYAKEALGIKSWDVYDNVIGAFGGQLERILTIGGDVSESGPSAMKNANRFPPIVKYFGPFHLNSNEKKTLDFTLPSYIGSVRIMVVAGYKGAYGFAEKAVQVKQPLMVLATLPRVLAPTETTILPVTVFAMEKNISNVNVTLQANKFFDIIGETTQSVKFNGTGEQMVYFNIKVKDEVGIGKIKVSASGGGEKANTDIELNINNPNQLVTQFSEKVLSASQSFTETVMPYGMLSSAKALLEISSVPSMNLESRLEYLIQYPHGCIEQTTSAIFPQLLLSQLLDLDANRKAEIDRNIRKGIDRLKLFQRTDGGFSYWPGIGYSDEWGSNYAGHFLLKAIEKGYNVAPSTMQSWKSFMRSKANSWSPSVNRYYGEDLTQAYRLYLLAKAKSPEMGAMNRLKEFAYLSPEAKWQLAAAYKVAGQDQVALNLVSGLPTDFMKRDYWGMTYGSDLRDQALVLQTLVLLGRKTEAMNMVNKIAASLSSQSWYSTQTTAYCLIAIADFCGSNPSGMKIMAKGKINGKDITINSNSYIFHLPIEMKKDGSSVSISNTGNAMMYVRIIRQGKPLTGESVVYNNNASVLQMQVSYLTRDGKPMDVSKLQQGTDFVAKVSVTNPVERLVYQQMALTQIFPGGWEILNTRMLNDGGFQNSAMDYQDIRDDRVNTYFYLMPKETKTYYVLLNASYIGKYYLPGTYTEAMYDKRINNGVGGKWIEVVK